MSKALRKFAIRVILVCLYMIAPAAVLAQNAYDILGTPFYDPGSGEGTGSICLGSGTLPANVPDPYNSIFTAASNKFQISSALLAAIFYAGEHGSSWPQPPPPYGHGSLWASSGVPSPGSPDWPTQPPGPGAAGPFQFEYPTWQTYGVDGNGDGSTDVEDLTDAAFGAAKYLAAAGAKNTSDQQAIQKAIFAYNHSQAYVNNVWNAYVAFSAGGPGTATNSCPSGGSGGFTNPFPDGWVPNRLDMGYDGHFTNRVVSPCDGTMAYVNPDSDHSSNGGWEGAFMTVQCSQTISAIASGSFYFAEGLSPTVKQGQSVTAGQQIAVPGWTGYSEGPGGIEWGMADPNDPGNALAIKSQQGCPGNGTYRSEVLTFAQWAEQVLKLAPPSSSDQAGCA